MDNNRKQIMEFLVDSRHDATAITSWLKDIGKGDMGTGILVLSDYMSTKNMMKMFVVGGVIGGIAVGLGRQGMKMAKHGINKMKEYKEKGESYVNAIEKIKKKQEQEPHALPNEMEREEDA